MKDKQAILIMCHNDFYILEKSLELLDNEHFDFYIHVDAKVKDFDFDKYKKIIKRGRLFYTDRINVIWGDYSQIETELLLIKEALNRDNYLYLHLISGSDLPIKSSKEIVKYFEENYPTEFIGYNDFDGIKEHMANRVKYFRSIAPDFRENEETKKTYRDEIEYQKSTGVDRLKTNPFTLRVGSNWFSITSELAEYVLLQESNIREHFSSGYCADELFLQSIVYDSEFFKNVCKKYKNDNENCKRLIDWKRGCPYTFTKNDYDEIMSSTAMFARKFSTSVDKEIIDMIYDKVKQGKDKKVTDMDENKKIAVYYIATGDYKNLFPDFLESLQNLYPSNQKIVKLISDGLEEYKDYEKGKVRVDLCPRINDYPWPIVALYKMWHILENIDKTCDYSCYFNANSIINPHSPICFDLDKLTVSYHSFCSKKWEYDPWQYIDLSKESSAYLENGTYEYVQSGFFFGPTPLIEKMCEEVIQLLKYDTACHIFAQWHDESYLNKWVVQNRNLVDIKHIMTVYKEDLDETRFIYLKNKKEYKIGRK